MFGNLARKPPPAALISQDPPIAYAALRDGLVGSDPAPLAMAHVWAVLDDYHAARCHERDVLWLSSAAMKVNCRRSAASGRRARSSSSPRCCVRLTKTLVARKGALDSFLPGTARPRRHAGDPERRGHVRVHRRMPRAVSCRDAAAPRRGNRHDRSGLRRPISISRSARRRCWFRSAAPATARRASRRSILPTSLLTIFTTLRSLATLKARWPAGSQRPATEWRSCCPRKRTTKALR